MTTLNQDIRQFKIEKEFAWLLTLAVLIAGLPILKNAVVFILEKLYELFIQYSVGK
jgi:hypothetical protein